jgi:DMSO/TMAO reductase YedYZ heme-binding membrane subunit
MALGHNIYYGRYYFIHLFTEIEELSPPYIAATVNSLVLIAIMLPLMVTSFRGVRKRMKAESWKKLQRWAYPFYALLYVHVLILFIASINTALANGWEIADDVISLAVYSVVYIPYFILRPAKYFKMKKNRAASRKAAG